jgi:hypothetical protein
MNKIEKKTFKFRWEEDIHREFVDMVGLFKDKHGKEPVFTGVRPPESQYHLNVLSSVVSKFCGQDIEALEIGSYVGESSKIFAGHFDSLTCVDPYGKRNEWSKVDDMKEVVTHKEDSVDVAVKTSDENELVRFIFENDVVAHHANISFYCCTSDDYFEHYVDKRFNFIYVDGDHRYSQQIRDYTNGLNHLAKDGILGGHDYSWPSTQRVIKDMGFDKRPILHFRDDSFLVIPESLL